MNKQIKGEASNTERKRFSRHKMFYNLKRKTIKLFLRLSLLSLIFVNLCLVKDLNKLLLFILHFKREI